MVLEHVSAIEIVFAASILAIGAATTVIARYAWQRRQTAGATSLAVLLVGVAVWNVSHGLQILFTNRAILWATQTTTYLGVAACVTGFLTLVLEFTGRSHLLTRRTIALLAVEPVLVVTVSATNPWHDLMWESAAESSDFAGQMGPAFVGHTIYSFGLLLIGIGLLIQQTVNTRAIYRRQAGLILLGVTAPFTAQILWLASMTPTDLTPIAFAITGVAVAWAITRNRLIDLAPIARDQVVDTLPDPVIVLDDQDRITDLNDAGSSLLGNPEGGLIGTDFGVAFDNDEVVDLVRDAIQTKRIVRLPVGDTIRIYEIRVTPIQDRRGTTHGRVLVFHDVTDREQSRQELEHQNEQLERFASVVSHDLRNPLSVAEGYLPMARETGEDEHFEAIEESLERMNTIIEDVLTLAREGSRIEDREPVSLQEVTTTAWEQVDTRDATLRCDTDVTIGADANRLQRLLENLFRNSIEHGSKTPGSQPGQSAGAGSAENTTADLAANHLTVTVEPIKPADDDQVPEPDDWGFFVEDDGVGIPADRHEEIFEPGHSSSSNGTGLGLSIVQGIAEAHGWSVRATDAANGGARFEITGAPPIGHAAGVGESAEAGAQR
ncbi:histidine kinase N-terminal 7TM domain-containing protein [Salinarchaeum laminariae]|uniref:histidine kinase N-terminal 7TM domain-containing protein n=1 Tax=Salinarchaeum laminariae TaxID=869888 RepID=UPI0020BE934D|nr:histidine kinase N-terminal 7TM domain-containing protein [Salinarchaeum laminariae]